MDDDTRYDHLPLLGSGRFGKVYAQGDKALKFVKSSRTEFGVHDEIIREATIAGQIRFFQQKGVEGSDRVVEFLGASLTAHNGTIEFLLEMALARGGSLFDIVACELFDNSPEIISTLISDINVALMFCQYTCGILVRDLSLNNILITSFEPMRFVLADFGKARPVPDNLVNVEYSEGYHGAPLFQPPRAFYDYNKRVDNNINHGWDEADFYSLGVIAVCCCDSDEFWRCSPERSDTEDPEDLYLAFALEGVPHLLKNAEKGMNKADFGMVSRWINRELLRAKITQS